jgi:RAB protein geranylgeranyltransferase component A
VHRAAAKAGKTVLHIDPAPHYGAHWATLTLEQFLAWAEKQSGKSLLSSSDISYDIAARHSPSSSALFNTNKYWKMVDGWVSLRGGSH